MNPLRFQPIFRQYLWGGRRLQSVLGKAIGAGNDFAESWEIVDRGTDQSLVLAGEFQGKSLGGLVAEQGQSLLGKHHPQSQFPLLFKFLDAQQQLSVQVHPNDARAAQLAPPDLGKTEAWVVLSAEPGSVIYAGLKAGFDRVALTREVANQTTQRCLHEIHPEPGDCFFLPAGVVHSIGAGLVVAEIQQSSDSTYRLYDWNRIGKDGRQRELHVERALEAIDYDWGLVERQVPQPTEHADCEQLVSCDKFVMNRWSANGPIDLSLDDRMQIIAMLKGTGSVDGDPCERPFGVGDTMLVPAACTDVILRPQNAATLLQIYLP